MSMVPGTGPGAGIRPLFRSLGVAASGLTAQRMRIDTVATNLANAQTTRTPEGGPYRRRIVLLEEVMAGQAGLQAGGRVTPTPGEGGGVRVAGIQEVEAEGPLVYDPGHPDADVDGYVQLPNVNTSEELIELLSGRRLFEANASVFQAVKSMLRRAAQL